MSAPRAEDIDYACAKCGLVTAGPHTDEHVPDVQHATHYKGAPISHTLCPDCQANTWDKQVAERQREKRRGHWWFKEGI